MTDLFIAVSDRLKSEVPALKWIDADDGELENFESRPALAFPCALIDIQLPNCEDYNTVHQLCHALIRVRVAFDTTGERTSAQTPAAARQRSLEKYAVVDGVYKALQGFCADAFTELSRKTSASALVRGYKVYDITFETTFEDETAL